MNRKHQNEQAMEVGMMVLFNRKAPSSFWGNEDLSDLLRLVGVKMSPKRVSRFTAQQMKDVGQWASLEYLAASDNDVTRKPRPVCLGAA